MIFTRLVSLYNQCFFWKTQLWRESLSLLLSRTFFIKRYYTVNELIWQDGFLLDFLQKKFIDKWLRKFVIYSGFIYSERLLFDWIVRFYLDLVVWAGHKKSIFEFNNVANTLLVLILMIIFCFLTLVLFYVGWVI